MGLFSKKLDVKSIIKLQQESSSLTDLLRLLNADFPDKSREKQKTMFPSCFLMARGEISMFELNHTSVSKYDIGTLETYVYDAYISKQEIKCAKEKARNENTLPEDAIYTITALRKLLESNYLSNIQAGQQFAVDLVKFPETTVIGLVLTAFFLQQGGFFTGKYDDARTLLRDYLDVESQKIVSHFDSLSRLWVALAYLTDL